MDNEAFLRIRYVIVSLLFVHPNEINLNTTADDIVADSLDAVDIVMGIEEEFGIDLSDEEIENCLTVGDLVNYMVSRGKENWAATTINLVTSIKLK